MRTSLKSALLLCLVILQNSHFAFSQTSKPDFDEDQLKEIESNAEKHEFQTEVGRLMDIIINSLYTQKEIFLRELISNSSDALDKIRFQSVSDPDSLGENKELAIRVEYDPEAKTLSITDTGIGMTKQDLISNLGTIAKSGTTNFIEAIKGGSLNLIGQFGVGFYSTFLAGHKVQVTSKHSSEEDQWIWESSAAHSFTVSKDPRGNTLGRGSKVTVFLKQDAYEFAEEERVRGLIKKYSEFINFPIYLRVSKEVTKEVPVEEEEKKEEKTEDGEEKKEDVEVKEEEKEEKKAKTKTITEKVWEWQLVNDNKAIWLRSKEDIEEQEYNNFYKSLTKETDNPTTYIHFTAEGEVEFKSILFVPSKPPSEMFDNYYGRSSALKLYVRRVLINEEFEDLMPRYLSFVKGVVDSDELPLNVSRESLQQLKMMKVISRKLVRKAIEMIRKIAEVKDDDDDDDDDDEDKKKEEKKEDEEEKKDTKTDEEKEAEKKKKKEKAVQKYNTFFKSFGKNVKLGIIEDPGNRAKLAKLTRWYTSKSPDKFVSLDEYIVNAKAGQDNIYFMAGESKANLMKSPVLQALLKKGYEVLLLDDPIDEFVFQHLTEYEKKKMVNVGKGDFKFPDDDDSLRRKLKKLKRLYQPLTDWWKKLMPEQIENVQVSQRLVDDPCVVISNEHGHSANMERIGKAQAYASTDKGAFYSEQKKILEVNPNHPIVKELLERVKDGANAETEELAKLLTETAFINSGFTLQQPQDYASKFYKLFRGALGISKDAEVEEVDIDLEEDEDEGDKKDDKKTETPNESDVYTIPPENIKVEAHSADEERKSKDDL